MNNKSGDKPGNPGSKQDEDAIALMQGLFELARNGGTSPLSVMLDAGVPVSICTSTGDSLLILACRNGHLDTARMLLDRGADPSAANHQSETPLMVASLADHTDLVECLLEAGADQ